MSKPSIHKLPGKFLQRQVVDIASTRVKTILESQNLLDAVLLMQEENIGSLLVVNEKDMLVGIITERDILKAASARPLDQLDQICLSQVATTSPRTVKNTTSIARVLHEFSVGNFRHLPVIHAREFPVAIVSSQDVFEFVLKEFKKELEQLSKNSAAPQSGGLGDLLHGTVQNLKPVSAICLSEDVEIGSALKIMNQHKIGSILTLNRAGELAGIFTEKDLIRKVPGPADFHGKLGKYATANPLLISNQSAIAEALEIMSKNQIRHLPVVPEQARPDQTTGIISIKNCINLLSSTIVKDLSQARVAG